MRKNLVLAAILGLVFAGCSTNLGNYSVLSTGNLQMKPMVKGEYVEGSDCLGYILGIPLGNTANRLSAATADALERAGKNGFRAEALENATMWETNWSFIGLFGQNCIKVKGQPIKSKDEF